MKKRTTLILGLLVIIIAVSSCKKGGNDSDVVKINETNLTPCPANTNCQYLFTEHADINIENGQTLKTGNSRVFWSVWQNSDMTTNVYVKAPMDGTSFSLDKEDILNGKVQYFSSCPACYMVAMKNVDGYVKGVNLTPEKSADQSKWIIEAKIIREPISSSLQGELPTPLYRDTVFVKQYFYPNFIYN